jgi:hypothetical protein
MAHFRARTKPSWKIISAWVVVLLRVVRGIYYAVASSRKLIAH